jgi:hypothetical protein
MKIPPRTGRDCLGLLLVVMMRSPVATAEVVRSVDGETGLANWSFTAGDVEIE